MSQRPLPASVAERTVPDLLDARAADRADHPAILASSLLTGTEVARTYAQLRDDAARLSASLAAAGVGKGDRVGILLANDGAAEAILTYHAVHRLGAINVPLNTRYVARELAFVLEFVAPAAIVFAPAYAGLLSELQPSLGDAVLIEVADEPVLGASLAQALDDGDPGHPRTTVGELDDADWIFTSGTTGNPKAVGLTHAESVACGHQSVPLWGLDATSVYQGFAPFFTSTGCHTNQLAALVAGCTYVIDTEFDVRGTLERMERYGTTSIFLISAVLQLIFARLTKEEIAALRFPALRRVCYGAQPGPASFYRRVWEEIGQGWGVEVVNVYGLTEGGTSGMMLINDDHPEALQRLGANGMSIGRTTFHPWIEHTVLAEDGTPAAVGEPGELCLRGPSSMSRYVRDEEASRLALRDGWLHTGDMALIDDAGFVFFVDRSKQIIRRGGLNISSAEVEGVLGEHPGILEAAAVPMPNPVLGEDVRGVVVASTDPPPTEAELIAWCRERLADYKVPARVDFLDALPRNAMGRVMKGLLTGEDGALHGAGL
ncbi:acyl--CoA ligase [Baekduia soli]|uniref:Acyl--CoA ligase n=1 Tax=Baekduia soli TaxID=496014 RepID=A0A5B8U562_9ACTN|nr:class I adenylate-forming enzyme family protein [Baekduia soli]QEC48081.1 acyl--CoA ligase [Baekduia soli]